MVLPWSRLAPPPDPAEVRPLDREVQPAWGVPRAAVGIATPRRSRRAGGATSLPTPACPAPARRVGALPLRMSERRGVSRAMREELARGWACAPVLARVSSRACVRVRTPSSPRRYAAAPPAARAVPPAACVPDIRAGGDAPPAVPLPLGRAGRPESRLGPAQRAQWAQKGGDRDDSVDVPGPPIRQRSQVTSRQSAKRSFPRRSSPREGRAAVGGFELVAGPPTPPALSPRPKPFDARGVERPTVPLH